MNEQLCFVDIDAFGKTYKNANYVHGSSIQEAYLRWLPVFQIQENSKRRAAVHLKLVDGSGKALHSSLESRMPGATGQVHFWSSAEHEHDCVICRDDSVSLAAYHPVFQRKADLHADNVDIDQLVLELETEPKAKLAPKRKAKRKKDAPLKTVADTPQCVPNPVVSKLCTPEQPEETTASLKGQAQPSGAKEHTEIVDEGEMVPTEVDRYENIEGQRGDSLPLQMDQGFNLSTMDVMPRITQETHYELTDECLDGLHTVVEELAGVVRNLAVSVRSLTTISEDRTADVENLVKTIQQNSQAIQNLSAVTMENSSNIQLLAKEAAQDRKLMIQLMQNLSKQ